VLAALNPDRYEIVPVGITRSGQWVIAHEAAALLAAGEPLGIDGPATTGEPIESIGSLVAASNASRSEDETIPTVVLPVLHGPNGEDGTVSGLLELAGLPYAGSGVAGSAVAMDKGLAKALLTAAGIPQAAYRAISEWEITEALLDDIAEELKYPLFVKPANMGSSVGVSKANDRDEFGDAVREALRFDERLVIEESINGREIEIAVLGNERPVCSVAGEIIPGSDFYDYEDKYRSGTAQLLIPAPLSDEQYTELVDLATRTYQTLRAEVLSRVDVFFDEGGRGFLVNEINTFPGFTNISMFPMLWSHSGLAYADLLDEMIRLALERAHRRQRG
jgi:D-alanine-D-alanine ligase